jgi:hypothetical protein
MLPRADDNRQVNVSRKRMHTKREEEEEREEEEREENNTAKNKGSREYKNICQRSTSLPHL